MANWVVGNLENALGTWNEKLNEIWSLITQSPETFKDGTIWEVIVNINRSSSSHWFSFISNILSGRSCKNLSEVLQK